MKGHRITNNVVWHSDLDSYYTNAGDISGTIGISAEEAIKALQKVGQALAAGLTTQGARTMDTSTSTVDINAILAMSTDDLDPDDEDMYDFTVPTAEYDVTLRYSVNVDEAEVSSSEAESFTITTVGHSPDAELEIDLDEIESTSDYYWSTYDFESYDNEYDDDGHQTIGAWRSSNYFEAMFGAGSVEIEYRIDAEISGDVERKFLHDVDREDECGCPVCEAKAPFRGLINNISAVVGAIRHRYDSTGGIVKYSCDSHEGVTVEAADGTRRQIAFVDKVDGQNVWIVASSEGEAAWPFVTGSDSDKIEGLDLTVADVRKLFFAEIEQRFTKSPFTKRGTNAYATGDIKLYKVTGPRGEAKNGGDFTYDLPTKAEEKDRWGYVSTTWTPGAWTPKIDDLRMCRVGYHVTTRPIGWANLNSRFWEVEVDGAQERLNDDKVVCQSVRLVKEVDPITLYPRFGAARSMLMDTFMPAYTEGINAAQAGTDDSTLPDFAMVDVSAQSARYESMFALGVMPDADHDDLSFYEIDNLTRTAVQDEVINAGTAVTLAVGLASGFIGDILRVKLSRNSHTNLDHQRIDAMIDIIKSGYFPVGIDGPFGKLRVIPMSKLLPNNTFTNVTLGYRA